MGTDMTYEEIEAYKKSVIEKEKKDAFKFVIVLIAGCVLLFVFPPLGMILIVIAFIMDIILCFKCLRTRRKNPEIWKKPNSKYSVNNTYAVSESQQSLHKQGTNDRRGMNVAQKAVASYTLGKAATTMMNAGKQNVKSENPNAERYAKAQRDAMNHRNLSSTRKNGRETVRFKNGGNGYIETESNGAQYLVDNGHHRIGSYDPIRNETYDVNGRKVGKGNLLKTLLS